MNILRFYLAKKLSKIENKNFKIFYGSTTLILNAYQNINYKEGIFYDKETFSLNNYFDKWKTNMLNFDSEILTFREILTKDYKEGNWFIRPIYDDKSFSGLIASVFSVG